MDPASVFSHSVDLGHIVVFGVLKSPMWQHLMRDDSPTLSDGGYPTPIPPKVLNQYPTPSSVLYASRERRVHVPPGSVRCLQLDNLHWSGCFFMKLEHLLQDNEEEEKREKEREIKKEEKEKKKEEKEHKKEEKKKEEKEHKKLKWKKKKLVSKAGAAVGGGKIDHLDF